MIIVLVLLAIIFIFQSKKQTSQPTETSTNYFADVSNSSISVSTFTSNCFASYIQSFVANIKNNNLSENVPTGADSCFTETFIQQWPSITSSTESDPVLISQDYYPSWINNVSSSVITQSQSSATVLVNIGTGTEIEQLIASLEFTPQGWRISGVSSAK